MGNNCSRAVRVSTLMPHKTTSQRQFVNPRSRRNPLEHRLDSTDPDGELRDLWCIVPGPIHRSSLLRHRSQTWLASCPQSFRGLLEGKRNTSRLGARMTRWECYWTG